MVALWLFLFLAGAFASAAYIRKAGNDKPYAYSVPIMGIMVVLLFLIVLGERYDHSIVKTGYFAGSLLLVWVCKTRWFPLYRAL